MKLFKKHQWNREELKRHHKKWDIIFYATFVALILTYTLSQTTDGIEVPLVYTALVLFSILLVAGSYSAGIVTADKKLKK